jgi:hypothetical protein
MTRKQYDKLRREFFSKGGRLRGLINAHVANRRGQVLEKGAYVTVVGKGGGLTVETELCKHCKQKSYIRGVEYSKVDLIPEAKPRREPELIDAEEGDF